MKKYLKVKFFLIVSVVGLLAPFLARADNPLDPSIWGAKLGAHVANSVGSLFSLSGIAAKVIGWVAYSISYLISSLASVVIMLQTWITQVLLHMNGQVIQSAIVQNGFQVTLSIANLGFITALIVIAVATILRRETYGIKQLLWKLIVAALLVNFSLVFVGVIINFSDQLTSYFLKAFPGQGGGSIIPHNPFDAGAGSFAERLVVAFQPQQYLAATGGADGGNVEDLATQASAGWGSFASAGSSIGQMLAPIASIIMVTLGLIMIVIILAVFNFMLIVRYLYLSILIILMPLVWVAWIFPSMQKHWGDWWSKFLKWTFFAPIVIFFMWLVITTGSVMGNNQNTDVGSPFYGVEANFSSTAGGLMGGISNFFGGAFTPLILTFLKGIVLVGLMVGGLIVANSLSITGAKAGIAAAKGAARGMSGWVGRKTGGRVGGALTRAPTEKERTGWRKYTPASLTRSLLHDKLKIKEKAFEEKAQGKPGMASALYDYGNKYTKAKVKAEEEKSRLGPAKYYAKKVTIGPLKTLFGANQDSLLGSMVIGAAYGSGLFKKKGAKKFKKKELLEQGFSEEEIESMKDKGWDIESDAEEKKKENGGEETKMPKNKSKTYMPE